MTLGLFHARDGGITDMEDERKERGGLGCVIIGGALMCLFLPVLYVLSAGPAVWLIDHNFITIEVAGPFYAPIYYLAEAFPSFERFIGWYSSFFRPA